MEYLKAIKKIMTKACAFGQKELAGATLAGHVPHVAPEAWFHKLFLSLNAAEINELENEIGIVFPEDFKSLLMYSNGASLFSGELSIYGYRRNFERTVEAALSQPFSIVTSNTVEKLPNAKPSYLFIGGYIDDGSKLLIDCETEHVYRCKADDASGLLNKWANLDQMMTEEIERFETLFDETGHLINELGPTTPESNWA